MPELDSMCQWFALCANPATGTLRGPIGNGEFGDVPICDRCRALAGDTLLQSLADEEE